MAEHVEGDFKQFVFKMATPSDYPKILTHLRKAFYPQEPLCKLAELGEQDFDGMDKFVEEHLNLGDDLSFYVEEKASGKVAGVRVTYKCTPTGPDVDASYFSVRVANVFGMVKKAGDMVNLFDLYGIDHYADFLMTSVGSEFTRQGLVTEIYRRSMNLLRAKGYPLCKSVFTSPYTRKAASNLQFQELCRIYARDEKDENGQNIFPHAGPDDCAAVMVYKLL